jgi:hypothetical protein
LPFVLDPEPAEQDEAPEPSNDTAPASVPRLRAAFRAVVADDECIIEVEPRQLTEQEEDAIVARLVALALKTP